MNQFITFIMLFVWCFFGYGQNEKSQWYFGSFAGINFLSSPPSALPNSTMSTVEGCSSVADISGNLLFYTDGSTVWNQLHQVMANGTGLLGNGPSYSTQAALIVRNPANNNTFYIFTVDDLAGPNGLMVHQVDMNLAAGNGSVIVKNQQLFTPSTEKLCAAQHCNGTDVWVVSHDWNNNTFRSFLVTASGINSAVTSSAGPILAGNTAGSLGYMKISPLGNKLGVTNISNTVSALELYDFDNTSGLVSNQNTLLTGGNIRDCEFSPDGTKFYCTTVLTGTTSLTQWDLCSGNIGASAFSYSSGANLIGIQAATNDKIYISRVGFQNLAVINFPNNTGQSIGFTDIGLVLNTGSCNAGLPNFVANTHAAAKDTLLFDYPLNSACLTATFHMPCSTKLRTLNGIQWVFGDNASGATNTSTLTDPSHTFSQAGNYTVKLILYSPCSSDTLTRQITITNNIPSLNITGPVTLCTGETRSLLASGALNYSWTGIGNTTSISISPTITSSYTLQGWNQTNCVTSKTISVSVLKCSGIYLYQSNRIVTFPNPFENALIVQAEHYPLTIQIYSIEGLLLIDKTINQKEVIETSTLNNGLFLLRKISDRQLTEQLIIKQAH